MVDLLQLTNIMSYNEDSSIDKKEYLNNTEKGIELETNAKLIESLDIDKEKILKQLKSAKNAEDRVKLFAKRTDSFWLEALVWLFEEVGDFTPAIISTCYLLAEWIHIWLPWQDCLKILWYQTADALIGAIPAIWDIADFFFKSNKYSSKIFSEHLDKLKEVALEKGVSIEEINAICKKETRFIKTMDKFIDYKSKKKNKKNNKSTKEAA